MNNKTVGGLGERLASDYVRQKGYNIITTNFHTRSGELDIITSKDKTLVFIEVKTRNNIKKGKPYESINYYKLRHLKSAINYFLLTNNYADYKLRLDVVTILLGPGNNPLEIKHFENVELS